MRISEAADITGLSASNIRFYEKKGLLTPKRNEESQYRDYSQEDIVRLKKILLYRKTGLPIETIYLLLNNEMTLEKALQRQRQELLSQKETIEGSLALCRKLLETSGKEPDVDVYLNYVFEKEQQGFRFAPLEELLEEISDFSGLSRFVACFGADPRTGGLFAKPWVKRMIAAFLTVLVMSIGIAQIYLGFKENGSLLNQRRSLYWLAWLVLVTASFFIFHKNGGKNNQNNQGNQDQGNTKGRNTASKDGECR